MVHAGIGPTHVNSLLTSMNIPSVSNSTLNRRQKEAGAAIEEVARESCTQSLHHEKEAQMKIQSHSENDKSNDLVNLTVSYDMGWQKRGRAHNSLTGLHESVVYFLFSDEIKFYFVKHSFSNLSF